MNVQLELWHLISLLIALLTLIGAFGKVLLSQFEKRLDDRFQAMELLRKNSTDHWNSEFEALEDRLAENTAKLQALSLQLPQEYVRREDWIRFSTMIDAKLDRLMERLNARP